MRINVLLTIYSAGKQRQGRPEPPSCVQGGPKDAQGAGVGPGSWDKLGGSGFGFREEHPPSSSVHGNLAKRMEWQPVKPRLLGETVNFFHL